MSTSFKGLAWWSAAAGFAIANPRLVADMVVAGGSDPEYRAMAARGSETYLSAIAAGDVAHDRDVSDRAAVCAACPRRVMAMSPGPASGFVYEWCGVPLRALLAGERGHEAVARLSIEGRALGGDWDTVDWERVVGPACGCLLELKRRVASSVCPAGLWVEVARAG
ncbi:MAG: hypothetical protein ACKVZJ_10135 [Phycisphaerales bacterium]